MKKIKPRPRPITAEKQARMLRFGIYAGRMLAEDAMKSYDLFPMSAPRLLGRLGNASVRTYNTIIDRERLRRSVEELPKDGKGCNCNQYGPDCGIC